MTGRCYLTTVETAWQRGLDYYAVPWRASWQGALGGCLLSHAVHAHDMLSYIVGPVARVSAFGKTLVNPVETEECADAALQMADGALATLAVTLGSVEEISRLRFCFQHLVAESNTRPYDNSSEPWSFIGKSPEVERDITEALHGFQPEQEGYDGQFLHMHRALVAGGAWPADAPSRVWPSNSPLRSITRRQPAAPSNCRLRRTTPRIVAGGGHRRGDLLACEPARLEIVPLGKGCRTRSLMGIGPAWGVLPPGQ